MAESSTQSMLNVLDDVTNHIADCFDPDDYQGFGTVGFASITDIDGRKSFVHRLRMMSEADQPDKSITVEETERRDGWEVTTRSPARPDFIVHKAASGTGYRLSITNIGQLVSGPKYQRMDIREDIYDMLLSRLQLLGYCQEARRTSRMD